MSVSLEVSKRGVRPHSLKNELCHGGEVPAVVHGYKVENTLISFDGLILSRLLREHGTNTVTTTDIDGQKVSTLVHKIQMNTFANHFRHTEFLSANMSEETKVEMEVALTGKSMGVKSSGVLAQSLYTVVVSATPDKLSERIGVDAIGLELGDSITVADLPKSDDYKFVTGSEEQIAAVVVQSEEEENTGEGDEPEVIDSTEE